MVSGECWRLQYSTRNLESFMLPTNIHSVCLGGTCWDCLPSLPGLSHWLSFCFLLCDSLNSSVLGKKLSWKVNRLLTTLVSAVITSPVSFLRLFFLFNFSKLEFFAQTSRQMDLDARILLCWKRIENLTGNYSFLGIDFHKHGEPAYPLASYGDGWGSSKSEEKQRTCIWD